MIEIIDVLIDSTIFIISERVNFIYLANLRTGLLSDSFSPEDHVPQSEHENLCFIEVVVLYVPLACSFLEPQFGHTCKPLIEERLTPVVIQGRSLK